jgi:hypothetical protein
MTASRSVALGTKEAWLIPLAPIEPARSPLFPQMPRSAPSLGLLALNRYGLPTIDALEHCKPWEGTELRDDASKLHLSATVGATEECFNCLGHGFRNQPIVRLLRTKKTSARAGGRRQGGLTARQPNGTGKLANWGPVRIALRAALHRQGVASIRSPRRRPPLGNGIAIGRKQ